MSGGNETLSKQSKVVKYKVEQDVVNLRKQGLSFEKIAEELNASGKIPENDQLDKFVIKRFLDKMPEVTKEIVQGNKHRLIEVVNTSMDIIFEVNSMFQKTKNILESLEEDAVRNGRTVDVYKWKAVVSEMREMLRQMGDIQKEINDYNNVRKFMEVVIETLTEECPDKLPIIAEKLKAAKGTQWFADIMNQKSR
jgi:hypothetical protein